MHRVSHGEIQEALALQKEMAAEVKFHDDFDASIATIGGMDVSHTPFDPEEMIFGAVTLFSYPSLSLIQTATSVQQQKFPYVPGLLDLFRN